MSPPEGKVKHRCPGATPTDPEHDLTGKRFTRLVVTAFVGRTPKYRKLVWVAVCDCGEEVVVKSQELLRGDTKSCGCLAAESTSQRNQTNARHSMRRSPEYVSWASAKGRCFNVRDKDYPRYGGRGITMAQEWANDFAAFLAHMGRRPAGTTLERIDVDRGYMPGNCRWATPKEQARNRRNTTWVSLNGVTMDVCGWAEHFGVTPAAIVNRIKSKGTLDGYDPRRSRKRRDQEDA